MTERQLKPPWLVRINHRMRAASFALLFVATSLHIVGKNYPLGAWLFFGLLLLIYPHVQYWRAGRAENPIEAEMNNLLVDAFLLGIYVAGLAFPIWITFSALLGTLINNALNKGWRGVSAAIPVFLGGSLIGSAVGGFRFSPQTDWPATLFCMIGLGGYLLAMGNIAFAQNRQLRLTREKLKSRERDLLTANETLVNNLRAIDELHKQLQEQAIRDPLTSLYNRRFLDGTLERELARCQREGKPLSLIMIDVDHFKAYNDRFGHPSGDTCLKVVANTLQASAKRASDMVVRYGGEEFLLVLADTDAAHAQPVAEALRQSIELLAVPDEQSNGAKVTISAGVSTMTNEAYKDVASLLRAADEALYRAKQGGRNQVQVAPETPPLWGAGDNVAANFVQLVWHRAYECSQAVIDDQHRELFAHANRLLAAILSARPAGEVAGLIDGLIGNVAGHFHDEEAILAQAGYPGTAEHAAIHRQLVARATDLAGQFKAGTLGFGDLFQFLAHELVARHMLGADREFFPYFAGDAQESGAASAKSELV